MILPSPIPTNEAECRRKLEILAFAPEDEARIRRIAPAINCRLESIIAQFYADLARHPEAGVFFLDQADLEHLKRIQADYFRKLTSGDYGPDRFIDPLRVGRAHEAAGLPMQWYLATYLYYFRRAADAIALDSPVPPQEALASLSSLAKLLFLDITLGIEAYLNARLDRDGIFQSTKLSTLLELISVAAHELSARAECSRTEDDVSRGSTISECLKQCQSIGKSLLAFAHNQPSPKVNLDFNRLVADTVAIFEYQITRQGILLCSQLEPTPAPVMANPRQLKQVLARLLVDAQHAISSRNDAGKITVRTRVVSEKILCTVEHDSSAITGGDPGASAPKSSAPGSGTCRTILKEHGGDLTLRSGQRGGIATIELPLSRNSGSEASGQRAAPSVLHGKQILIVDDKAEVRLFVSETMERARARVSAVPSVSEARKLLHGGRFDLVIVDIRLPDGCAEEIIANVISKPPKVRPGVIVFAEGESDQAALTLADSLGFLCLCKPFTADQIRAAATDTLSMKGASGCAGIPWCCADARSPQGIAPSGRETGRKPLDESLAHAPHTFQDLVGSSPPMQEVFRRLRLASQSDVAVLLTGETGTGKELVARAIHDLGDRKDKRFVAVNCSAFPDTLLESELFGHVRGAFTGAIRDKAGVFQAAEGGTLFLDEVGDMSPLLQLKLLRVLEEMEIRRVGDDQPIKINVRLITATHRDLATLVAAGQIREDFYYRIRVFRIHTPPLRERKEDIPSLVTHFMEQLSLSGKKRVTGISNDAMERLMAYPWPGNVRELRNAIEHSFVSIRRGILTINDLPPEIRVQFASVPVSPSLSPSAPDRAQPKLEEHMELERRRILDALEKCGGNKTRAAKCLGITRVTLWNRINRLKSALDRSFPTATPDSLPLFPQSMIGKPPRASAIPNERQDGERRRILDALRKCGGNKTLAARSLGITRVTLRNRIIRLGIQLPSP